MEVPPNSYISYSTRYIRFEIYATTTILFSIMKSNMESTLICGVQCDLYVKRQAER